MLERILRFFEQSIPRPLYRALQGPYHFTLALLGNLIYGAPSRKLTVIGVTGTKGKTTTCLLIAHILNSAGVKTGLVSSVRIGIASEELVNDTKHAMPGRFALQKLLSKMARAGCTHAVIETSSEGILQHRHRFIDYDITVFTNLSPEHIERHGGFENYRAAKFKLFKKTAKKEDGIGVYNLDDEHASYFLQAPIKTKIGFTLRNSQLPVTRRHVVSRVELLKDRTRFAFDGKPVATPLIGECNLYNTAAAICVALLKGIPFVKIQEALQTFAPPPGRFEIIQAPQGFTVIIDYAHEPMSLKAAYRTARLFNPRRLICLMGSQGGGRDAWKRPEMGRIAGEHCDAVVVTNEDPYDEDPESIMKDIQSGVLRTRLPASSLSVIEDRSAAIAKALVLAGKGDVVILTGKGGETWMCLQRGEKIPWDERRVVTETLDSMKAS